MKYRRAAFVVLFVVTAMLIMGCMADSTIPQIPFKYEGENELWKASWTGTYPADFKLSDRDPHDMLQTSVASLHFKGTSQELSRIESLGIRWTSPSNPNFISDSGLYEKDISEPIKYDYLFAASFVTDFEVENDEVYWDILISGEQQRIVLKRVDPKTTIQKSQSEEAKLVAGYIAIIDQLMLQSQNDINLNELKYLAIDTTQMSEVDGVNLELFWREIDNRYDYELLDKTYTQLVDEKYIIDHVFPNGAFVQIKNVDIEKDKMTADASICFAALGGHGFNGMEIDYQNNEWKPVKIKEIWIA